VSDPGRESHYEVLGVGPRATQEQIERAYRFLRDMYGDVSIATYTLLDPEEMRAARARVHHAFEVLSDPERRREYDASQEPRDRAVLPFSPPVGAEVPASSPSLPPAPPEPVTLPETVTGPDLRRLRESRGVSLGAISASSKVGVRFLEYIEGDRHELLPARVYLRSFLIEYAKALGADPTALADAYMARVKTEG
jgi:curved DNA-binding protein CbpA